MPTTAQAGTTFHRTLTRDAYGETWTDELAGRADPCTPARRWK